MNNHEHCLGCFDFFCTYENCETISCNKCGKQMHECKVSDHVEICAGELTQCPYNTCGCVTVLPRERILAHLHRCRYSPRSMKEDVDENEILYIEIKTGHVCTEFPKHLNGNDEEIEKNENERVEKHNDETIQEPIEIQCPICVEDINIQESIQCLNPDGHHAFCKNCVKTHIETNVDELLLADSADGINCLFPDCKSEILNGHIIKLIDDKIARRLENRLIDQNLALMQNIERCKSCHFAMEIEDNIDLNQFFICLMCGAIFCRFEKLQHCDENTFRRCKRDGDKHYNGDNLITCEILDQQEAEKSFRDTEKEMSEAVIRICPKCSLAFIKQEGCNKMTCRCGGTLCYLCRAPNICYDHFCGHDKAPGSNCNKCDKTCSLFELAEPKDEEVLRKIISKNNRYIPHTPQPVDDGSSTVQQGINFFRNLYAMYNQ